MDTPWSLFVRYSCYFGLALMLAALPLSRYFMSVGQIILAGVFICEEIDVNRISDLNKENKGLIRFLLFISVAVKEGFVNILRKFGLFFKNKPAWIFSSILLIDIIGITYSTDLAHGIKVVRNNLPLLLLPLFLSSIEKIPQRIFNHLMLIFVAAVLAGTINSTYLLINQDIVDTRQISPFIHHSRFSIMVCMAIFVLAFYSFQKDIFSFTVRMTFIPVMIWLIVFLFMLRSLTGIAAFFVVLCVLMLTAAVKSADKPYRISMIAVLLVVPVMIGIYVYQTVTRYIDVEPVMYDQLEKHTPGGGIYIHDTTMGVEEGKYIGLYLCWEEMEREWNSRSSIPFDSLDLKGQEIRYTLIRYLSSKGLRKDSTGMAVLTPQDQYYIENGIANIHDLKKFSIRNRIDHTIMAYQSYREKGIRSGSSTIERIEQGKAAVNIIGDHWLIGVGTGDAQSMFQEELTRMESPLQSAKKGMFNSHNQFLTYLVVSGVLGLIWFLFAILYPAIVTKAFKKYFFIVFLTIALISFLGDDTLNTQAGVTFFSFFYSWFVFGYR